MIYSIRHFNRYRYSRPVSQSTLEVRMHPRSEQSQRCFTFELSVTPRARVFSYTDHMGNVIYHFDMPQPHTELTIIADALVDVVPPLDLPDRLEGDAWRELDELVERDDYWDMLMPSYFARPCDELDKLAAKLGVTERNGRDPLTVVRTLNEDLFNAIEYKKQTTTVDSPIDDALTSGKGVCQDFAHIMITLLRKLRIPARYVSGYVYVDSTHKDRSAEGATHAWVEALLPGLGWVGFDPTNNLVAGGRHIRTAIGRDYADVPPTKGTMLGSAASDLKVRVRVAPAGTVLPPEPGYPSSDDRTFSQVLKLDEAVRVQAIQQQQQVAAQQQQ
jgi:transglutaminase-like putative cysteine protease